MIKKLGLVFAILFIAFSIQSPFVKADNEKIQNNQLNELTEKVISDSLEVFLIDLNNKALEVKYEDTIKNYEDSKKTLSNYEADVTGAAYNLEIVQKQLKAANNDTERAAISNNVSNILSRYMVAKNSFKGRVNSYVSQMKQAEPLILQKKQGSISKQNEIEKLKYTFQKDYFQLMTSNKEFEMQTQDMQNIKKQLDVESIKLARGLSTEDKVNDLSKKLNDTYNNLADQENSVNQLNDNMKTTLNMSVDEVLKIEYQIPKIDFIKDYRLTELLENFKKYNTDLETTTLNEQILKDAWEKYKIAYKLDDPYITYSKNTLDKEDSDLLLTAEYDYLKATYTTKSTERSAETYVKNSYYAYQKAFNSYKASLNNNDLLNSKLEILDKNFEAGNISAVDYSVQKQELIRSKFNAEKAVINFINTSRQMELVNKGIWLK